MVNGARVPPIRLDLPSTLDPKAAARRLLESPGAFLLVDEPAGRATVGAWPSDVSEALDPEAELPFDPERSDVARWVGILPYEAFRDLERPAVTRTPEDRAPPHVVAPRWLRYPAVAVFDAAGVRVEGDDPRSVRRLHSALSEVRAEDLPSRSLAGATNQPLVEEPPEIHAARVRRALEHIAAGDLYQVNLARRFEFPLAGHPIEILTELGTLAAAPFAAALDLGELGVVSASPELFLHVDARRRAVTRPIKGTRPRGTNPEEDAALCAELDASEKERAELAMIIDVERNDLGRLARAGSVRLTRPPRVVSHATVHHREAEVVADLRGGVSREGVLRATMPSGSVTGAPKVRAMELIAITETERRGLYTGAIGAVGHDGSLRLSMAIRTLTVRDGVAHYFAGGGIVADSDPDAEVLETLWKARQLARLVPALGPQRR